MVTRLKEAKATKTKKPLSFLIKEWSLYPRNDVRAGHVAEMVDALQTGASLPPIITDQHGRIVDGFHRRDAYMRVYGPEHQVDVEVREYGGDEEEVEAAAYADAVKLNVAHGLNLSSDEKIKAMLRLQEYGIDEDIIPMIILMPKPKVEKRTFRVAIDKAQEPVPLRGGDDHLKGRVLDDDQIAALRSRSGAPYGRLAREIIRGCQQDLLPDDDSFYEVLKELYEAVGKALEKRGV